jgi:hypothetical protein
VGVDLRRRRSVLVRLTESGEQRDAVRIMNDPCVLAAVMGPAGEHPEVVLEATCGWYWVRTCCPGWAHRGIWRIRWGEGVRVSAGEERVRRRRRSGGSVADGPVAGGLDRTTGNPGSCGSWSGTGRSWCTPGGVCAQVHAVLAGQGVQLPVSDRFGVRGGKLLRQLELSAVHRYRIDSLLRRDPGFAAVKAISGVG